jgi:hypothetical protein
MFNYMPVNQSEGWYHHQLAGDVHIMHLNVEDLKREYISLKFDCERISEQRAREIRLVLEMSAEVTCVKANQLQIIGDADLQQRENISDA